MYLCANTDTFSQNVSVPIQIQYQKMYLCADTDTFSDTFWLYFYQSILFFKFLLNKMCFFVPLCSIEEITKITIDIDLGSN